jgi:hypothetical protein
MFWDREHKTSAEEEIDTQAAHGLGWTSIGIGLAEIAAPGAGSESARDR